MSKLEQQLTELLSRSVSAVGFELWGVEVFSPQQKTSTIRVYIDHPHGISIEDCAQVSEQISAVLDVEDPIKHEYNLEVSSPGLDRLLFTAEQFSRFIGSEVLIQLRKPLGKLKKFQGEIIEVVDKEINLVAGQENIKVMFSDIRSANLVPNFLK